MLNRLLPPLLVGLALVFALSACSKSSSPAGSAAGLARAPYQSQISLEAVSAQGCLNVERFFDRLNGLDPSRPTVVVPTAIAFDSADGVRDAFRKLIAYGQLTIARETMAQAQAVPDAQQDDCKKLTLTGTDGAPKDYAIKNSARDSVAAQADDGESWELTWLTPQRYVAKHRYPVLDQPCGTSDKPVFVTVAKVTDWSDEGVPARVPAEGSAFSIAADFLGFATGAVGDDADSLYVTAGDGSRAIDLGKVSALASKPPKPEVISCDGIADRGAAPAPPGDPSTNPSTNPDDPFNPFNPDHPFPGDGDLPRR